MEFNFIAIIVTLFATLLQSYANGNANPVVTVNTGKVRGTVLVSTEGKNYNAFRGIPYAKPPVKELRFQPPKPAEPWNGIYDATVGGAMCPQLPESGSQIAGDENCLFLNVYTPENYVGKSYPVLFYVPGGGFLSGTGNYETYGPDKFMNLQDLVLVTINYRLGVLGFVSTGDENAPGNYAMLDQVLSLQWVQENIAKFGGNPSKVTAFGMSAGGASVAHLILSPLTKGLFHAAIAQSGSTLGSWCLQRKPLYWATKIAQELNCPTANTKEMVECFRKTPVQELVESESNVHIAPLFPMYLSPVIEPPGGPGFLTEDPMVLLKEGRVGNKVPFVTGITEDEGDVFVNLIKSGFKTTGQEFLDNEFQSEYLPHIVPKVDSGLKKIGKAIQKEYFGDKDVNDPDVLENGLSDIFADAMFRVGAETTLSLMAEAGVPTYAYFFNHNSTTAPLWAKALGSKPGKVDHGSEIPIQFRCHLIPELETMETEDDKTFSKLINTLMKNFADKKKPSFEGTPFEDQSLEWLPYVATRPRFMEINVNPTMREGRLTNKMKFWTEVIPRLAQQHRDDEL